MLDRVTEDRRNHSSPFTFASLTPKLTVVFPLSVMRRQQHSVPLQFAQRGGLQGLPGWDGECAPPSQLESAWRTAPQLSSARSPDRPIPSISGYGKPHPGVSTSELLGQVGDGARVPPRAADLRPATFRPVCLIEGREGASKDPNHRILDRADDAHLNLLKNGPIRAVTDRFHAR